jgi:hypothetical protein
MSQSLRRFAPRSAVSAADLQPLEIARLDLDETGSDPAETFLELARRLVGFRVAQPEAEVTGSVIHLGSIALPD